MVLFLKGLALGFSAAAQPGPFQAYLLAQSLRNGAARTLPVILVPLVSDPPVIAAVLAVLAQLPPGFLRVLQIAGGGVVLWLGAGTLRALARPPAPEGPPRGPPRGFVRAVFVNFTNPNVWIFWSLVGGPILAEAWHASPARSALFLAGFYLLLVGGNAAFVLLAGQARRFGPPFARGLAAASGIALVLFGIWQVGRGIAGT